MLATMCMASLPMFDFHIKIFEVPHCLLVAMEHLWAKIWMSALVSDFNGQSQETINFGLEFKFPLAVYYVKLLSYSIHT
jgi:hypothetical protein